MDFSKQIVVAKKGNLFIHLDSYLSNKMGAVHNSLVCKCPQPERMVISCVQ